MTDEPDTRLCAIYGVDCRPEGPCPGCCLSRGGQWDGKRWIYPDGTPVYNYSGGFRG